MKAASAMQRTRVHTCVIFDVDGTLVDSSAFDDRCYHAAVREAIREYETLPDWTHYEHATDTGILMEICRRHGASIVETMVRVRERFGDLVAAHLRDAGRCPPMRGASALFDALKGGGVHAIGIATGGWGHTAAMKLKHAGFDLRGVPIATADHHHTRAGIMRQCRERLPQTARTVYIGDREWDAAASASLGWEFIGVGARLRDRCATWVPDLSSPLLDAALAPPP
jgi:phosphoglycolate phosphatase-like HAD superfamily hydrolase